jgi:Uma2 family endonuclease
MEQTNDPTRIEYRVAMSYEDYQQQFLDNHFVEWVDGEAIVFALPTLHHQQILGYLVSLISLFLSIYPSGECLMGPVEMKLSPTGNARVPDILFVATENQARIDEQRVNGAADLVIEIVDTETVRRDREEKLYDYQKNGVREYWVIDPRTDFTRADFWVLDETGRYRPIPIAPDGIYHSTVLPNFKLNVNSLFEDELPDPIKVLLDLVGIDALTRARDHSQ